jgi:hypothetical protein
MDFSIELIVPAELESWGRHSLLTEISTINLPVDKERSARKADNLKVICEPTVYKMSEPRRVKLLRTSGARNSDSFRFLKLRSALGATQPGVLSLEWGCRGMKLTTLLHLVLR